MTHKVVKPLLLGVVSSLISFLLLFMRVGHLIYLQYILSFPIYLYLLVKIIKTTDTDFLTKFKNGFLFSLVLGVGYGLILFLAMQLSSVNVLETWDASTESFRQVNRAELTSFSFGIFTTIIIFNAASGAIFSAIFSGLINNTELENSKS
jgi:hypothetical protein